MKLMIFESHPVQYHAPVYRELHRLCQQSGQGSVQVIYATDSSVRGHFDPGFGQSVAWDEPLLEGYSAAVLNNENGTPLQGFNSLTGNGIGRLLKRERPDAVLLTGLAYRFDWAAYFACLRLGIPFWIRTETQDEAFVRGWFKSLVRAGFYRAAYLPIAQALVIGKLNAEHYQRHGLSAARHLRAPYCVVDRFQNLNPVEVKARREAIRKSAGFSEDTTVLLFCGKLQPKKQPDALLHAVSRLPAPLRSRFSVLYVGSGEIESELRRAAGVHGIQSFFAGFRNQTELPAYYLAADVLVLPSRQMGETWGLVVNEAMLAERRVIISRFAGCHADFGAAPGVSIFDGSVDGLADALLNLAPAPVQGRQRRFMERYSIRAAAEGIATAMRLPRLAARPSAQARISAPAV